MKNIVLCACVVALTASGSLAATWVGYDGSTLPVEYTTGSGANASLLVVDFQNGSHYQFDYLWDYVDGNAPTGWDMIQAVGVLAGEPNPGGKLEYQFTDWGWGITVDALAYGGDIEVAGVVPPWPSWVYYTSDSATGYFPATANEGVNFRQLADESWDGWSWHVDGWGTGAAPVPEPASATLLLLGCAALLRRRKK